MELIGAAENPFGLTSLRQETKQLRQISSPHVLLTVIFVQCGEQRRSWAKTGREDLFELFTINTK